MQDDPAVEHNAGAALSLTRAAQAVYRRLLLVTFLPLIAAGFALVLSLAITDSYEGLTILQVDARSPVDATAQGKGEVDRKHYQTAIESQIERLQSRTVIDAVIKNLSLDDDPEFAASWLTKYVRSQFGLARSPLEIVEAALWRNLAVSQVRKTNLVTIQFLAHEPEKAARIANAIVAEYLKSEIQAKWHHVGSPADLVPATTGAASPSQQIFDALMARYADDAQLANARIVSNAAVPTSPSSPRRLQWFTFTAAVMFVIALAIALLLETLTMRDRVASGEPLPCDRLSSLPALDVEAATTLRSARLVVAEPSCRYARAIDDTVRELEKRRSSAGLLLVASSVAGEGSEHVASNIAHQLALRGGRVLLVDGDVRSKLLTRQLEVSSEKGLLDQLARRQSIEDAVLRDGSTGLHFLPASGQAPVSLSASDALKSSAFDSAIASLKTRFDAIVVSAPPLLPVIDSKLIAERADQIVFVTSRTKTASATAQAALRTLGRLQAKVSGAVETDAEDEEPTTVMGLAAVLSEARQAIGRAVAMQNAA